jgi:restriction endonuclease Mrr
MRVRTLSFGAYCHLIRHLLSRSGYSSVRSCAAAPRSGATRKCTGEGGLDLLAFSHTDFSTSLTAVQLKQLREVVPRRFVDELRGAMLRLRADQGILIATSSFSGMAAEAVRDPALPAVHLIDGNRLVGMLLDRGLGVRVASDRGEGAAQLKRQVFDAPFFDELETRVEQEGKGESGGANARETESTAL